MPWTYVTSNRAPSRPGGRDATSVPPFLLSRAKAHCHVVDMAPRRTDSRGALRQSHLHHTAAEIARRLATGEPPSVVMKSSRLNADARGGAAGAHAAYPQAGASSSTCDPDQLPGEGVGTLERKGRACTVIVRTSSVAQKRQANLRVGAVVANPLIVLVGRSHPESSHLRQHVAALEWSCRRRAVRSRCRASGHPPRRTPKCWPGRASGPGRRRRPTARAPRRS